jgi:hypothetical protein
MVSILCPLCKQECSTTSKSIVYSLVNKHFQVHLKSPEYGFCQNSDCDIVYFGTESDEIYFKRDLIETVKE